MSLEQLVQRWEQQVVDLGKRLVPGAAEARWREEAERLAQTISEHESHARYFYDATVQARSRIAENEVREAVLASQVEAYIHAKEQAKAYPLALELEEVRRQLAEDRAHLPCALKACEMHQARLTELEQSLAKVQLKIDHGAFV